MTYLFIRTCKKDDYIARLCLESWYLSGFSGTVIFLSEDYETTWLKDQTIQVRKECANFGGQLGARTLMDCFRQHRFNEFDTIISCDADVVIKENPLNFFTGDFGGTGGKSPLGNFTHISGQLMIFKGKYLNYVLAEEDYKIGMTVDNMVANNIDVLDDTYLSYRMSWFPELKIQLISNKWQHYKHYDKEPRTDWKQIIDEIHER